MVQNLMTGGASIEDTLALWASSLREAKRRIRPLFTQDRVATSAGQFLDALLGNEPSKTGWMRAELAGDGGPWRQLTAAHVPESVAFATKPRLAVGMVAGAIAAGVPFAYAIHAS